MIFESDDYALAGRTFKFHVVKYDAASGLSDITADFRVSFMDEVITPQFVPPLESKTI